MDHLKKLGSFVRSLPTLAVLGVITILALVPIFFVSNAQRRSVGKGLIEKTSTHDPRLPNYDIRSDKSAIHALANIRSRHGKTAVSVADKRDAAAAAEVDLRSKLSEVEVGYSPQTRMPEVISPSASAGKASLSRPIGRSRSETLRQFLAGNHGLFGIEPFEADALEAAADYTNPAGNMSFVRLEQKIDGIPVFAGEVRAGFAKNGDLVRVINNLAPGADAVVNREFGDPSAAFAAAARNIGREEYARRSYRRSEQNDGKVLFGEGDFAPTAEKMYFPTEPGVIVPAWRVLLWEPVNAYYVIVDADSHAVLWRKNITADQTQSVTYSVYSNSPSMINVADSPAPLSPGPIDPTLGTQGAITTRSNISLIGNEGVYSFNNLGWITDNVNVLDGNAVQAGPDRDCLQSSPGVCQTVQDEFGNVFVLPNNGVDTNISGSGSRVFNFSYNPGPGDPPPGDSPLPVGVNPSGCSLNPPAASDYQKGAATQLFYITNRYHDEMYRLGFTEAAGNFQNDNFNRGGAGGDRISAESQDCTGVNNANFSAPADGTRGRMQMYIFPNMSPDRDGSLDADIVVHELTHGLSNRLHGNSTGLTTNMAAGMGEGWSDFYAHALLSEPSDPINGVYPTGGYSTYLFRGAGFTSNYYYGIRRFPKAALAFTGGPNNRPHNPLTFADIDASQANLSDGAFAPSITGSSNDAVHAAGEVWSSMLWEIRAKYITRLGWEVGNRRILQHVTDGMKLSPLNPTFVDARDAIVAAAQAGGDAADVKDVWEGFAIRGLGVSATVEFVGSGGGETRVVQAFDDLNLTQPDITVSDVTGDNDGYPEPGEPVRVTIPLENRTGETASNVTVRLNGGQAVAYGSIAHNGSASNDFNFTIPANAGCGSIVTVTVAVESSLGPISYSRRIIVGIPNAAITENFDGVTAPAFPSGWTASIEGSALAFVTSPLFPESTPNSAYARNTANAGGTILTSPSYSIQAPGSTLTFRHNYRTEAGWDGGLLEYSINGGAWLDINSAGGGSWITGAYNGFLGDSQGNTIETRKAWTGNSNGYVTTKFFVPAAAVGQNIRFRWRFGSDDNTTGPGSNSGWYIDNLSLVNGFTCTYTPQSTRDVRADFDGDRRSDISVYRPNSGGGVWHILQSAGNNYRSVQFGASVDIPTPADYDNDNKTDIAVYRPGVGGNQGAFYIMRSSNFTFAVYGWGGGDDIPVVADYTGDQIPDIAVYRPSNGVWYIIPSEGGAYRAVQFGAPTDLPTPADFDGDGKTDIAVYRRGVSYGGVWYINFASGGFHVTQFGAATDMPVPADYDGDGKDDIAVYRPSSGHWWIVRSSNSGISAIQWGGNPADIPVPGDYDGDGKYDPAVYRQGVWWLNRSTSGMTALAFGSPTDIPIESAYIP